MAEVQAQLSGAVMFTPQEIAEFPKTSWLAGTGTPSDSLGVDGDMYLEGDTGDVYQKENGTWA